MVASEDSDMIAYGCTKILSKIKLDGTCVLYDSQYLHSCFGVKKKRKFQFDQFLTMCILNGTDFNDGIERIGLMTARKFIKTAKTSDIHVVSNK